MPWSGIRVGNVTRPPAAPVAAGRGTWADVGAAVGLAGALVATGVAGAGLHASRRAIAPRPVPAVSNPRNRRRSMRSYSVSGRSVGRIRRARHASGTVCSRERAHRISGALGLIPVFDGHNDVVSKLLG